MKSLMRVKKILMYFRKDTADNLSLNGELVELVNGDLVEAQGSTQGSSSSCCNAGARKTPVGGPRSSAACGRAEDARQQVAQVAVGAERARGCR